MTTLAGVCPEDLFECEMSNNNEIEQLSISLLQEIETELCDRLLHTDGGSPENDQTDGAIEFI